MSEQELTASRQTGCRIELVGKSAELDEVGGAGCLLRFSEWKSPFGDSLPKEVSS